MGITITGAKFVTQIGGVPQNPVGKDEIVGSSHYTYVSEEDLKTADSVTGFSSSLIVGQPDIEKINSVISKIKENIGEDGAGTNEVSELIHQYEATEKTDEKIKIARQILEGSASFAQVASFVLQLSQLLT